MADYLIMKAVEHDALPVKFKKVWPTVEALAAAGWWTQKKYDGCMGVAYMTQARHKCKMQSRTGEDYSVSCAGILDEIYEAASDQSGSWDDFVVIGEVWQPIHEAAFPAISGAFRRQKPALNNLRFIANDLLPPKLTTDRAYRLRFADLCQLFPPMSMDEAKVHVAETFHTESQPVAKALKWQGDGGFDGAILRDPDAGYTVGTVKHGEIVKVKPTLSLDLRCIDARTEPGAKTGRAVLTLSVEYRGVVSDVGSGVPHDMLVGDVCGQIVEIECLGITADGRLREPRFKGIRFDKTQPD